MPGLASLQRSLSVREAPVNHCVWSPTGNFVAVSIQSGEIDVFESNGKRTKKLKISQTVQEISWHPDETGLVFATHRGNVFLGTFSREICGSR